MNTATHRAKGFTLLELMGALLLMSAFALIAGHLFVTTLKVATAAREVPRPDRSREALIERMRADVWGAAEIVIARDQTLILRYARDRSIFWTIAPEQTGLHRRALTGTKVESEQTWPLTDPPERFEAYGPGVKMAWPLSLSPDGDETIYLYSELILLRGGGP